MNKKVFLKKSFGTRYIEEQCKVATLTERVVHAEISTHSSMKAAMQQSDSLHIVNNMKMTMADKKILQERVIDLECTVDEGSKLLEQATAAIPIVIIKIEKERRNRAQSWPLYI